MITKIVQIGNSKGVRIPNNILKLFQIENKIDMIVDEKKEEIILRPVKKPRDGWDKQFKIMSKNNDDTLIIDDNIDIDDWTW